MPLHSLGGPGGSWPVREQAQAALWRCEHPSQARPLSPLLHISLSRMFLPSLKFFPVGRDSSQSHGTVPAHRQV